MPDPWTHLRPLTPARIALGRAGTSLPTSELLRFSADHAAARDAVHTPLDLPNLTAQLAAAQLSSLTLHTPIASRHQYLQRPDLGRTLSPESRALLLAKPPATFNRDLVIILSDGLSALAAQSHAVPLLQLLLPLLPPAVTLAPLIIVPSARVALQDEIGQLLHAKLSLILLGERPGLTSPDSLGAYLTFDPPPGKTDAHRNCVSNIRPHGLPLPQAADTLAYLLTRALAERLTGPLLKDTRDNLLPRTSAPRSQLPPIR